MIEMVRSSVLLFFRGKLFQDPVAVTRNAFIGIAVTMLLCVGLVKAGLAYWIAAATAAFVGGALQPWLFRNLKYR